MTRVYFITNVIRLFIEDLQDRWADRNRRIKVAKIQRVFSREGGLIAGSFSTEYERVCEHPGRCAMGALLVAAGVTDANASKWGTTENATGIRHATIIREAYGLSIMETSDIIGANDGGTYNPVWSACGLNSRPEIKVRVCVVNAKVNELATA